MPLSNSDKDLKENLVTGRKNATSTSKTVQENVIRITGEYIRSKVTQLIQNENVLFSTVGDAVTDKFISRLKVSDSRTSFRSFREV